MAVYYALHIADVWTTQRGMDYDCVFEANPLLPKVPHLDRLLIHKTIFLSPVWMLDREKVLRNEDITFPLLMTAYVVHHNLKVIDSASKRCNKR